FANGALKHYFAGKDDIIRGAYERYLTSINDNMIEHLANKRGIEALETSIRATFPRVEEDATGARVLLSYLERCAFTSAEHSYTEHLKVWKAGYLQWLGEGREDGDILTETPD